jgi:leucyl aminopeptidase
MAGLLAAARGIEPRCQIVYPTGKPKGKSLVGKGITFDSGDYHSPPKSMER